jgi:hypothetical protein
VPSAPAPIGAWATLPDMPCPVLSDMPRPELPDMPSPVTSRQIIASHEDPRKRNAPKARLHDTTFPHQIWGLLGDLVWRSERGVDIQMDIRMDRLWAFGPGSSPHSGQDEGCGLVQPPDGSGEWLRSSAWLRDAGSGDTASRSAYLLASSGDIGGVVRNMPSDQLLRCCTGDPPRCELRGGEPVPVCCLC